jgi:RNA polymerase sigma-70 factor (ECF subfamily)
MDSTLSALLRAAAQADRRSEPSALEEEVVNLFDQFRDRLLRYTLSYGLSIQDGEEIVQEVFLALFQHLQRGKPRQNLRGWLFRVTHNLALKQRGQSRRNPEIAAGLYDAAMPVDPAPNPEDQLASSEREERLQQVLRALPERDQRCLYLRAEGLRYREIAEALAMSLGAVSMSLGRSLARFGRADRR